MRKTKIICTIGPASEDEHILGALMDKGMNAARLNFSHGTQEDHAVKIARIKKLRAEKGLHIAIILDTKGPEIRTGEFAVPEVKLKEGQRYILTTDEIAGDNVRCSISYRGLPADVKPGDAILIDDGLVKLIVSEVQGADIICTVMNAGIIKAHKGINIPDVKINLPSLTEKDISDIKMGIANGIDYIAASFVRRAADVLDIRKILDAAGSDIHIISKIENREGIENIDAIIAVSDGVMVARGDMGVEIPEEQVPIVQKQIIRKCNQKGIPVITATHMLDSMIRNPRPTRAEVTDVANAIFDGTDVTMLSGETAAGKYPLEALEMMDGIARTAEREFDYNHVHIIRMQTTPLRSVADAIGRATCTAAREMNAKAIITPTRSGDTAFTVSKFRPRVPIIAPCYERSVARRVALCFGAEAILIAKGDNPDAVYESAVNAIKKKGYVHDGDCIIITAGVPLMERGNTNTMRIHTVGHKLI